MQSVSNQLEAQEIFSNNDDNNNKHAQKQAMEEISMAVYSENQYKGKRVLKYKLRSWFQEV